MPGDATGSHAAAGQDPASIDATPPETPSASMRTTQVAPNLTTSAAGAVDAIDAYYAASSYRLSALIQAPGARPRALLDDYQLASFQDTRASAPHRASHTLASWRALDELVPPLPPVDSAQYLIGTPDTVVSAGPPSAAPSSTKAKGWRRVFSSKSISSEDGNQEGRSKRSLFGLRSSSQKDTGKSSGMSGTHSLAASNSTERSAAALGALSSSCLSPPSSPDSGSDHAPGTRSRSNSLSCQSYSLGGVAASLSPNFLASDKSRASIPSDSASGSNDRVKVKLPPTTNSYKSSATSPTGSLNSVRSHPNKPSSAKAFSFDVNRAQQVGQTYWDYLRQVTDRWPALSSPSSQESGVLVYTPHSSVHWFVSQLTLAEYLLVYSLGSLDASALPPFPAPPLHRRKGTDAPSHLVMSLEEEGQAVLPSATHLGIPSSTEYGSALLDLAAARVVDPFMETRAAYQKHATSRAGRFASGTSSSQSSRFGGRMSSPSDLSDEMMMGDTESAIDLMEDTAAASVVEAHVMIIRFFAMLNDPRIPAPCPIFERQRLAAMHANRPLSLLYQQSIQNTPAEVWLDRTAEQQGSAQDSETIEAMLVYLEKVLAQLDSLLPADVEAYVSVLDERWAVPIARGRRWCAQAQKRKPVSSVSSKVRSRWFSPEAHALLNRNQGIVVLNTITDPRFSTPQGTGSDMHDTAFFAAQPILSQNGMPLAMVCVSAPRPRQPVQAPNSSVKGREANASAANSEELYWTPTYDMALKAAAVQLTKLVGHAGAYAVSQRKQLMLYQHNLLQTHVGKLGLAEEGGGLKIGGGRAANRRPIAGPGLAQGLEEEVEASLEKEQLLAAFQERLAESRTKSTADARPDVLNDLLPRLGTLLTTTAINALGADLVYLARKPIKGLSSETPLPWSIVSQSVGTELPSTQIPMLSSDILLRLPLAPGAHNVTDHHGLPALFYNVAPYDSSDAPDPSLPWHYPTPPRHTFRSGAVISAGSLSLSSGENDPSHLTPPTSHGWAREQRSVFLLVILFADRTRIFNPAEQEFVGALAAGSIAWLRQAGALDAHIRTLTPINTPPSTSPILCTPAPNEGSRTRSRSRNEGTRARNRSRNEGSRTGSRSRTSPPPGVGTNRNAPQIVQPNAPPPALPASMEISYDTDNALASQAAALIFTPASTPRHQEDAQLVGQAAPQAQQSTYPRKTRPSGRP